MNLSINNYRVFLFFCLAFALNSYSYASDFDPGNEGDKLARGDLSFLKKLPGRDGKSLFTILKSNQLKVSKTSEDVFCVGQQAANAKLPEGCYFGFRIQRARYKDEYCSQTVGCAPCGLSMVYIQRPGSKQFTPYSSAAKFLAGGNLSPALGISDGDWNNASQYRNGGSVDAFLTLIDGDNKRYCGN